MAVDPQLLEDVKVILDKPLAAVTVRELLKLSVVMDDADDEELAALDIPKGAL